MGAKSDLAQTKQINGGDEKILATLGQSCASSEEEFQARQVPRSEEHAAPSETIKSLVDDDTRSLFEKTMSFMQVSSSTCVVLDQSRQVDVASNLILNVAMTHKGMVLVLLSMRVGFDSVTIGTKTNEAMSVQHRQEKTDEVVRHDTCLNWTCTATT